MQHILSGISVLALLAGGVLAPVRAQDARNDATAATKQANDALLQELPFSDTTDFDQRAQGLHRAAAEPRSSRARPATLIWDPEQVRLHQGGDAGAPDDGEPEPLAPVAAHQHLRPLQGHRRHLPGAQPRPLQHDDHRGQGGHHRHRPADLGRRRRRRRIDLYSRTAAQKPVMAVIYTHSHVDHYRRRARRRRRGRRKAGKVEDLRAGRLPRGGRRRERHGRQRHEPAAPATCTATSCRPSPKGQVGAGLGTTTSAGTVTLIPPTDIITETGQKEVIDGLTYEFLMAPGSEAPAEMLWFVAGEEGDWTAPRTPPTRCTTPTRCAAPRSASRCPGRST